MYAIVNIAGQQYKVEKDQKLFVHRLTDKEGETVRFDEVLLIDNDKNVLVGEPNIKGAMITGKVLSHPKGDKVQVFKKKKRKGYRVLRGHRQFLTEIQIQDIIEKGATKEAKAKAAVKTDTKAGAAAKASPEKAPEKKTTTTAKKTAPEKKTATEKKPAAVKETKESGSTARKTAAKKESGGTKAAAKPSAKKPAGTSTKAAPKKPSSGKKE